MKGFVLGFMNFSVINKSGKGFKERQKDYEEYKKSILDRGRLQLREEIFFGVTVPLFVEQHARLAKQGVLFRFCIAVSDKLPVDLMERFDQLVIENKDVFEVYKVGEEVSHSWLEVLHSQVGSLVNSSSVVNQADIIVANFRLDDDDLLSPDYFSRIVNYLSPCYEGFYLTFPKGYVGVFDKGYEGFYEITKPFLAIGLSRISKFDLSNNKFVTENPCVLVGASHARLVDRAVAILDSSINAYVWTMHVYSDTRSVDADKKKSKLKIRKFISDSKLKEVERKKVEGDFSIS